jgi:hypothetical protein
MSCLNQRGTSLMSMLVGLAIGTIAMLATLTCFNFLSKGFAGLTRRQEALQGIFLLEKEFFKSANCMKSFSDLKFVNEQAAVNPSTLNFLPNTPEILQTAYFERSKFHPNLVELNLVIFQTTAFGVQTAKTVQIPFFFEFDESGNVLNCASRPLSDDSPATCVPP